MVHKITLAGSGDKKESPQQITETRDKYEAAPTDEINQTARATSQVGAVSAPSPGGDQAKLDSVLKEIEQLQKSIDSLQTQSSNEATSYNWQTSDSDKPGDSSNSVGIIQLLVVFLISAGLGAYINRV